MAAPPLGYCNVGEVVAYGPGVTGFKVGDRVSSNGPHAELVAVHCILITLLMRLPFHGLGVHRFAGQSYLFTFGETFVVSGLGLIGLLTAQFLAAQGCRVLGLDPDPTKCALAGSVSLPYTSPQVLILLLGVLSKPMVLV